MMNIIMIILILSMIPAILLIINIYLSKKSIMSQEKMSPFECGFNPSSSARLPFSSQFFLISLIFLIFDIEIALLLPLITLSSNFNPHIISYSFLFLFILMLGLYLEFMESSLDWKI